VLAKGVTPDRMFAELLGRVDGTNRARGGSMHIADLGHGIYGANGIVAAGAPIAAGAAFAGRRDGLDRVSVCFFGDGGLNQGVLHETMNLAVIWSLPLVFVCENNGYAVTMASKRATAGEPVARALVYGMAAAQVDGMDVRAVERAAEEAVGRARVGQGPTFLECLSYRYFGHHTAERTMGLNYRSDEEMAIWRARDPLGIEAARLDRADVSTVDEQVEQLLDQAIEWARECARPDPVTAFDYQYADGPEPRRGVS
jgi:TPP-dependent pyruvate/acetoin dehydrogenase alpha subunit